MEEISIWDKLEDDLTIDRKLDREGSCGVDHWIISEPDGLRIIKPYHCGTCDACKHREGLEMRAKLYSSAWVNDLNAIKAPPRAIDTFVKSLNTNDYVRFPSSDGFDYLFSINGPGKDFFDTEFDWDNIMTRRKGTRKSGKLFIFKKDKLDQTIPLKNSRASSYNGALDAVKFAINLMDSEKELNTETELVTENNIFNAHILDRLRKRNCYIFDYTAEHGYSLPITFKPSIEDNTERIK